MGTTHSSVGLKTKTYKYSRTIHGAGRGDKEKKWNGKMSTRNEVGVKVV